VNAHCPPGGTETLVAQAHVQAGGQ